jgi:hypothetical protein
MYIDPPALSVRQPWADLIVIGRKTIEVRSWLTEYRGKVWLHAAKKGDPELERAFKVEAPARGAFLGSFRLSAVVPLDSTRWELWRPRHLIPGHYHPGHFAWIIENPIRFPEPISAPGMLNLFRPDAELQHQLAEAERDALSRP